MTCESHVTFESILYSAAAREEFMVTRESRHCIGWDGIVASVPVRRKVKWSCSHFPVFIPELPSRRRTAAFANGSLSLPTMAEVRLLGKRPALLACLFITRCSEGVGKGTFAA